MLREIKTKLEHYFVDEQNRKQGEFKKFDLNMKLIVHCYYLDGTLHGEFKSYHKDSNTLLKHCYYMNDVLHGEFKVYHQNGFLRMHTYMLHGHKHGEYKDFRSNGTIWEHSFCNYGRYHGVFKIYDSFGDVQTALMFYEGVMINVNPDTLTAKDKMYIMMCGRLPPKV